MINSLPLLLASVLIPLAGFYCQSEPEIKDTAIDYAPITVSNESWDETVDRAIALVDHDNEHALDLLVRCEEIATRAGDSACMTTAQRMKAQVLYRLGKTKEAILVFRRAFPLAIRHGQLQEQLSLLVSHGLTWSSMSLYDKALQNYFDASDLAVTVRDTAYLETIQNNIGFIYYKLKDYPKALYYWKQRSNPGRKADELSYIRDAT